MSLLKKVRNKLATVGVRGTLTCIYERLVSGNRQSYAGSETDNTVCQEKLDNAEAVKQSLRAARKTALQQYMAEKRQLVFTCQTEPEVTVLLVLWNQAELTLACLEALQAQNDGTWEILIVDNCSTDETPALLKTLTGVRIIYNEENVGFLKAVNAGARQAKGRYLLLLNNDAVVHPGSIQQAVKTIQSAPDIGAVGGRVILPNGLLQEAGSIVWQEGTCLGYARNYQPESNCVMFRRDVDYCSGVFLLTPAQLFCDMGGFDLRYAPAYYEESDYCIRLWKQGLRVVYDPFVVLDHYEFGSSKTSEQAMQLMQVNQRKFLEAHREFLSCHYEMKEENILPARMRNVAKGKVLVIDDRVPMHKLGAGYPRANFILHKLVEEQWFVTLYPVQHIIDNWQDVYDTIPAGIEVMLHYGIANLERFLEERQSYYDVIFISRPINMKAVKDIYERRPELFAHAKVVYDAEALWATREIMESEFRGISIPDSKQQRMIAAEVGLASFSDSVLAVTPQEAQYFRNAGCQDVQVLGHALCVTKTLNLFSERRDILFVGALADDGSPNVDSVVWFVQEILPLINKALPEPVQVYLIGRTGASELKKLASDQVQILGMVDDLTEWYNRCRIFIAPTRFAAGIPFKVHEASAYGLPSVVTPVLAAQLGWNQEEEILFAETAPAFAEQCIRLYSDQILWDKIREGAVNRIAQEHNPEHFKEVLSKVLSKS